MPNSLGATNGALVAKRILATLLEEFPFLRLISTDFSDEGAFKDQPIKIKLPTAMADDDYSETDGYEESAVAQADVDLTIDQFKHVTYAFNDAERTSHDVGLIERYARNATQALGLGLMDYLLGKVTNASFPNYTVNVAGTFDRGELLTISGKLDARKLPSAGRFGLFGTDHYKALKLDSQIVANAGSPSDTVRTGRIGDVDGIAVMKYAQLPDNGETLVGIVGTPEGLVIAGRVPTLPDQKSMRGGTVENVTEENTGLTIQVRSWYDFQKGKEFRTYTWLYGAEKGNADCIERVVTQAP